MGDAEVKSCTVCGSPFEPRRKSKTCSPKCSDTLTARRQRTYNETHPKKHSKHVTDEWAPRARVYRKINRAVKILFALTGEQNHVH